MQSSSIEKLESKGVATVLKEMALGEYGQPVSLYRDEVDVWIRSKESEVDTEASAKRDGREEEALRIARDANFSAREANELARSANSIASDANAFARRSSRIDKTIAIIAIIIEIISAIIAAMTYIKTP